MRGSPFLSGLRLLDRPRKALIVSAVVLLGSASLKAQEAAAPSEAAAPTSRPKQLSHAELVTAAAERPVSQPALTTASGAALTETQQSEIRRAKELMAAAQTSRASGDFLKGRQEAQQALDIFTKILGQNHYLSVSSVVLVGTLEAMAAAERAFSADIREADRHADEARKAWKASRFIEARTAAAKAIEIRERIFGKETVELAEPLRISGAAETELRALDDAERDLDRALLIAERTYGKNHPETAGILDRIGWRHIFAAKNEDAEKALRRALFIYQSTVGESPDAAETMDNLGTALAFKGSSEIAEAANLKLRALVIRQKLLGPDHKDTAVSLSNLAWLYSRVPSMSEEVIPLRRQALEIFERAMGPDARETVVEKGNLASAYRRIGRLEEALSLFQSMVEQDEKSGSPVDQNVVNHLTLVGTLYLETGKQADGEKTLRAAIEKCKALREKGEVGAAISEMEQIALSYHSRQMQEDAVDVRMTVWKWDQEAKTRVTEVFVRRCIQLGRVLCETGRAREAVDIMRRTVKDAADLYGKEERDMVVPLLGLATALMETGELSEATSVCNEATRIAERKYPRGSLSNAYAIDMMGQIQMAQKNYDLARFSFEEASSILERAKGADMVKEIAVARNLSKCLLALGESEEAVRVMRNAMAKVPEARVPYPMQAKTLRANTIHQLLAALDRDPSAPADERDKLKGELRTLLEELRDGKALNAEMKEWFKQLGLPEARGS